MKDPTISKFAVLLALTLVFLVINIKTQASALKFLTFWGMNVFLALATWFAFLVVIA